MIKKVFEKRIARYLLGGAITVAFEYGSFYLLYILLDWNLLLANSLSFCVGLVSSFVFNRLWAFNESSFNLKIHHQATIYASLAFINLILNNAIVGLLHLAGTNAMLSKMVAIIMIATWNYFIYKKIIFSASRQAR